MLNWPLVCNTIYASCAEKQKFLQTKSTLTVVVALSVLTQKQALKHTEWHRMMKNHSEALQDFQSIFKVNLNYYRVIDYPRISQYIAHYSWCWWLCLFLVTYRQGTIRTHANELFNTESPPSAILMQLSNEREGENGWNLVLNPKLILPHTFFIFIQPCVV